MIAHFLHRGGGPVWSNGAQLPHLDLTFPLAHSVIVSFSPFCIYGSHNPHTSSERSHLLILGLFRFFGFFFLPGAFSDLNQLLMFASLVIVHSCFLSLSFLKSSQQISKQRAHHHILLFADYIKLGKRIFICMKCMAVLSGMKNI